MSHFDQEFEQLCQHLVIEYDYNDLHIEGTIEINNELEAVKDHYQVLELFNNFKGELNLYIQEKDNQYQRIRRLKIEESNNQIEQYVTDKMVDISTQIQQVLSKQN